MVHIRFDDAEADADMGQADAPAAPAQAVLPANGSTSLAACCCRVRVDNNRNPSYVFRAVVNAQRDAAVASTSDNIVKAYALATSQLNHVCDLRGHSATIADVSFTDPSSLLHSSSRDGTVRGWDLRSGGKQTESFTTRQELYCHSVLEHLVAAGGQGEVFFWDRRKPASPLVTLPDTHMDEVTQVKIHSSQHVLSASGDGLVAVHDMSRGVADEDDNFSAALNVGTSVEEIGLYGHSQERLWVRTGTETLHLWDWRVATLSDKEGGHGAFAEWPEARATVAQAAASSSVASVFEEVGYLQSCHWDAATNQLMLVAGTEGSVGFFPLQEQAGPAGEPAMQGATLQPPVLVLQGAHIEVVRTVHCYSANTQEAFCMTGGEDGCLCLWSLNPALAPSVSPAVGTAAAQPSGQTGGAPGSGYGSYTSTIDDSMDAGPGPSRKEGKRVGGMGKQLRRQAPY